MSGIMENLLACVMNRLTYAFSVCMSLGNYP
jgi:hypothetical protein